MKSFFGYDGPVIVFFSKMADLIVLNILTIVFCIPVITIGASFTACYYTALKIQRGEGYVLKNFWKSFKDNIVKSTVIFCVFVVMGIIMLLILKVLSTNESGIMSAYLHGIYFVLTFGYLATLTWVFPIQSRFENSILTTIMKAFIMSCRYLFRTIVMMIMWMVPIFILIYLPIKWYSILFVFGISIPVYLSVRMYNRLFMALEELIEQPAVEE